MFYSVDRINGNCAVLISDDGEEITAGLNELPEHIIEGSVLTLSPSGYVKDTAEEERRRKNIRSLLDNLFE